MWTRPLLYFSRGRARQAAALCPVAGNDPVLLMVFTHPPMVFCRSDLVPQACVHFIWKLCSVDLIRLRPLDTSKWFLPQLQRHINGSKLRAEKPSLIYFIYFSPAMAQWLWSHTLVTDFTADICSYFSFPTVPSLSLLVLSCAKGHELPNVFPTLSGSP